MTAFAANTLHLVLTRGFLAAVLLVAGLTGCISSPEPTPSTPDATSRDNEQADSADQTSTVIEIYIDSDDLVYVDDELTTTEELAAILERLKETESAVHYARANPLAEPSTASLAVLDLIIENALPIALFADRDFQQRIGPDGSIETTS